MSDLLDLGLAPKKKTSKGKPKDKLPIGDKEKSAIADCLKLKKLLEIATAQLKSRTDYLKRKALKWALGRDNPPTSAVEAGDATITVSDRYATSRLVEPDALQEIEGLDYHKYFRTKQEVIIDVDLIPESKRHQFAVLFKELMDDPALPAEAVSQKTRIVHKPGFHDQRFSLPQEVNEAINTAYPMAMSVRFDKAKYSGIDAFETLDVIIDHASSSTHTTDPDSISDLHTS